MNIAIVDDENTCCTNLYNLIMDWAEQECYSISCNVFQDASDFVASLENTQYDIAFLDIFMKENNGIDTARLLRDKTKSCMIIFLTSSEDHRSDAFTVHAFDYIIKPATKDKVAYIMNEIVSVLPGSQSYIKLTFGKQTVPVLYSEIRYITSNLQYCIIEAEQTYRYRISFKEIEAALSGDSRFLTINRGILVNLDYVADMENSVCIMNDEKTFPLNTKKQTTLQQAFISHNFTRRIDSISRRLPNE